MKGGMGPPEEKTMNVATTEADFDLAKLQDRASGLKYGSFIQDLEESIAAQDWRQVAEDVAALRRYYEAVNAARRELAAR